jgi:chloramphenicol 3-O-phosphotransferase
LSKTEAEFNKIKTQLLAQTQKGLDQLKKDKENIENDIKDLEKEKEKIRKIIDDEKIYLEKIREEMKPLDDEIVLKRKQLDEIEIAKKEAAVRANSDINAAQVKSLKIFADAEKKAENENHVYVQSLMEKYDELITQQKELNAEKNRLQKEKNDMDLDKEALKEYKAFNEKLRERYEKASPEKITDLEINLSDEKKKYTELKRIYDEQTEKYNKVQITLANFETGSGTSIKNLLDAYETVKKRNEELERIHEKYPDEESISELENTKKKYETLVVKNDELARDRNRYKEEVIAMQIAQKELETVKRAADATKTLNEHLLKELESHKTALESKTGDTCSALTQVDSEVDKADFKNEINKRWNRESLSNLKDIVSHVKNYAGTRENPLYYRDDDIRAFLAGMAVSRLLILQGMSGTGKSSLPRIFSETISGFNRLIPVESSWRDRNELLGYFNDFNKKFNAKTFTIELYRSGKEICRNIPTFIILDEMNLSRIEYYFSDFLAILQETDPEKWMVELVSNDMRTFPMDISLEEKQLMKQDSTVYSIWERIEKSSRGELGATTTDDEKTKLEDYLKGRELMTGAKDLIDGRKLRIHKNVWFVGTANKDESTFEITDKVYDRAQVLSLDKKGEPEQYNKVIQKRIDIDILEGLFENAIKGFKGQTKAIEAKLKEIDKLLSENFDTSFGNRIVQQTIDFAAVFTAAGGKPEDALDYQISTKILRKVLTSDDIKALGEFQKFSLENTYERTESLISKRLKDLTR